LKKTNTEINGESFGATTNSLFKYFGLNSTLCHGRAAACIHACSSFVPVPVRAELVPLLRSETLVAQACALRWMVGWAFAGPRQWEESQPSKTWPLLTPSETEKHYPRVLRPDAAFRHDV